MKKANVKIGELYFAKAGATGTMNESVNTNTKTDAQLIDEIAKMWVRGGGDADGFTWLHQRIKERIREIESEENLHVDR